MSVGRTLILVFAFVLAILVPRHADAETYQRMLLYSGSYTIGGGGDSNIPARCLDVFSKEPGAGLNYTSTPSGFGNAQVSIGSGPPIPLATALKNKLVSIEGTGVGFISMRVKNLGSTPVTLHISSPTVLTADDSYPVEDLKDVYPQLLAHVSKYATLMKDVDFSDMNSADTADLLDYLAYLDNQEIWELRTTNSALALSPEQSNEIEDTPLSSERLLFYTAALNKRSDAAFLMRFGSPQGPQHILISRTGTLIKSSPFGGIQELVDTAMEAAGNDKKLDLVIGGEGTQADFDVTSLMIAAAAARTPSRDITLLGAVPGFPQAPAGWQQISWLRDVGGNGMTAGPPTSVTGGGGSSGTGRIMSAGPDRKGPYVYNERFSRGEVTATAWQEFKIATMGWAIHRYLGTLGAVKETPEEVFRNLKAEVNADLEELYLVAPFLRGSSDGPVPPAATLDAVLDGTFFNSPMAVREPYETEMRQRYAASELPR